MCELEERFIKEQVTICDGKGNYTTKEVLADLDQLITIYKTGEVITRREEERRFHDDTTLVTSNLGETITMGELRERGKKLRESRERGEKEVDGPIELWF